MPTFESARCAPPARTAITKSTTDRTSNAEKISSADIETIRSSIDTSASKLNATITYQPPALPTGRTEPVTILGFVSKHRNQTWPQIIDHVSREPVPSHPAQLTKIEITPTSQPQLEGPALTRPDTWQLNLTYQLFHLPTK